MKSALNLTTDSVLNKELAIDLAKEWHKNFCPSLNKWVKKRPSKGYRWENVIFDDEGKNAFDLYLQNKVHEYYVMPEDFGNNNNTEIYKTANQPFKHLPIEAVDCYIFPKNLAWSMAFTHEVGWLGPYFTKHKNYKVLQKKNEQAYNASKFYYFKK